MSDEDFAKCSDLALKLTRALMNDLELKTFGYDEVAVFNCVLKNIVAIENGSSNETR